MRVRLHDEADEELIEAALWYEGERPGRGDRFLDAYHVAFECLEQYEHIGPRVYRRIRRKRILDFPYDIVYEILEDHIFILAIAHHSRRPGYWRDRRGYP